MKQVSRLYIYAAFLLLLAGCGQQKATDVQSEKESKMAKELFQGIWVDDETEEEVFQVKGDTVYFPDVFSKPAYFKIVNDTLVLGNNHYFIEKQGKYVFWFRNQANDLVKLHNTGESYEFVDFSNVSSQVLQTPDEVAKSDTVVFFQGERYHCYIAVNPTKYKVVSTTSYTHDGVEVENVYYDNIIHVSVYSGKNPLFSSNFKKQMFSEVVPDEFLAEAIFVKMQFVRVDNRGFLFKATLSVPDDATSYQVSVIIGFDGELTMELLED